MLKTYFVSTISLEEMRTQFLNQLKNLEDRIEVIKGRLKELHEAVGD